MPKWPRQYADDICKLGSPKERRDYLASVVPENLRDIVKVHVGVAFRDKVKKRNKNRD